MKSHLPYHPQIYVPVRLRCNHEITYTYHMTLHTTGQVLGRHQVALENVSNSFQSWWSCRPCLDKINLHQRHCSSGLTCDLSIAICCIFTWPLTFWETVNVLLWSVLALWALSPSLVTTHTHTPTSWAGSCFRQLLNYRLVKLLFNTYA